MKRNRQLTLLLSVNLCLVFGYLLVEPAYGQLARIARQDALLADDDILICHAGADLSGVGGGLRANAAAINPAIKVSNQRVLLQVVNRLDIDRDRQLAHRELQALDTVTRRQLLSQLDTNLDRKLSTDELPQRDSLQADQKNDPLGVAQSGYPYSRQPTIKTLQRESFQNIRRFGIGITQAQPPQRPQPFARAATFGSTSSYYRAAPVSTIGRSGPTSGRSNFRTRATGVLYLQVGRCQ